MAADKNSDSTNVCRVCGKALTGGAKGAFCGERCRLYDLSMWFNEDYRIKHPEPATDDPLDGTQGDTD
jgi:endogenous inhibitor of DNA gyrase (YacG/DUF329 family)